MSARTRGPIPALFTSASIRPKRLIVSRTSEILSGSEAMSARIGTNFWPGTLTFAAQSAAVSAAAAAFPA